MDILECKVCRLFKPIQLQKLYAGGQKAYINPETGSRWSGSICDSCVKNSRKSKRLNNLKEIACSVCSTKFMQRSWLSSVCSPKCKKLNVAKWYKNKRFKWLDCKDCGVKYPNEHKHLRCIDCRNKPKLKFCKACNVNIHTSKTYCATCLPSKYTKNSIRTIVCCCGNQFTSNYKKAKYCTPKCSPAYKRSKKRRRGVEKLRLKQQMPKWANKQAILDFYANCPEGCVVDHIIPLKGQNVSGLHIETNLQYLSIEDNTLKSNKFDGTLENKSWKTY